jgi:membrane associated rhomboid family serine protease
MNRLTPVVKNLIILNVGLYVILNIILPKTHEVMTADGPALMSDVAYRLSLFNFSSPEFSPYQLFTHMFVHGGFMHLFFNMLWLFFMGPIVEQIIGEKKFIILYVLSGLGAGLIQNFSHMYDPSVSISLGASGAVAGVMMATALKVPNMEIIIFPLPMPFKLKYFVMFYAGREVFSAMSKSYSGVAHFAHLGGMLIGLILILLWDQLDKRKTHSR